MKKLNNVTSKDIDVEFFQTLQDKLADEFGVASIMVDTEGVPLTKPSNFTKFCHKFMRKSEIGLVKCMTCDRYGGTRAAESKKPVVYRCYAGLIDFASPILMGDHLIGYFLCGQVLDQKPDLEKAISIAKELRIPRTFYPEYLSSLDEIEVLSYKKIEAIAELVYQFSSRLSKFALYKEKINQSNNHTGELLGKLLTEKIAESQEDPENSSIKSKFRALKKDITETLFKRY